MKTKFLYLFLSAMMLPSLAMAGEPSKGTLIMMSSVGGWIFVTSGLMFFKEAKRVRRERMSKQDDQQ